eukprot:scaffold7676_cov138-Isochrysis_galbana.AAC.3
MVGQAEYADLALALAHDARTKQLLAISRGEPPPPLNSHQARLSPLATLDEEAELLFSDVLHNHLTEYDLTQYTANRTQQKPTTQSDRIRQRHTEWVPEAGSTQVPNRRATSKQASPAGCATTVLRIPNVLGAR